MPPAPQTWDVRVTRPFYHAGALRTAGETLSLPMAFAAEMINSNKAKRVIAPPAPADTPAPAPADTPAPAPTSKTRARE